MADLPNFQDLYDEAKDELTSDPDHQFVDFGAGSWLDAFVSTIAITGQGVLRWISKRFLTAFVSTSTGADLDFVVLDRYELSRNPGELDADFKNRVKTYTANLARATRKALLFYTQGVDGVLSAELVEDLELGLVTIFVEVDESFVEADVLAELRADVDSWRAFPVSVSFEVLS